MIICLALMFFCFAIYSPMIVLWGCLVIMLMLLINSLL